MNDDDKDDDDDVNDDDKRSRPRLDGRSPLKHRPKEAKNNLKRRRMWKGHHDNSYAQS